MNLDPRKMAKKIYDVGGQPLVDALVKYDKDHDGQIFMGLARYAFKLVEYLFALAYIPVIRDKIPSLDPEESEMNWIPINKDIEGSEGIALPEEVLDRLIDIADYRVILTSCACRRVYNCEACPQDIGCLFMGESAKQISPSVCYEATAKEAKAHIRKAVKAGLVPVVGEARADHELLRIPSEGTLLTACFCCECCCLSRFMRRGPQQLLNGMMPPLKGLSIEITDDCIACGKCESICFLEAIKVMGDRAVINDYCRMCGRCAGACPKNAIKLKLDNYPDAVDDVVNRVLSRVTLSQ